MLGSWSESPTSIILHESLNAFKRLSKSSASIIEASSIIITSHESGFLSFRANCCLSSLVHSTSKRRCMVLASLPVSSVIRFAALPVGAASSISRSLFANSLIIALSVVVLPVPGPPVSTSTPLSNASNIARRCSSSKVMLSCLSTFSISRESTVTLESIYLLTEISRAAICSSAE